MQDASTLAYLAVLTMFSFTHSQKCIFMSLGDSMYTERPTQCVNIARACNRTFTIKSISVPPFSNTSVLRFMLRQCCGRCLRPNAINISSIPHSKNTFTNAMVKLRAESDFLLPFVGPSNSKKLLGWWFIPLVNVPSFFLITRKKQNILSELVTETLELYPLVIICLTLAVITGFIMWIIETWYNVEEFQRSFLHGWFEGFWWSFISMTTVGYGDKVPKKFLARLIAVIWIFMGIALFGIVTAQITNILVQANNPPAPTVRGKTVGVLKYRAYDISYVARNGGIVYHMPNKTESDDFYSDINHLIQTLRTTTKIEGIILDKSTMSYTMKYLQDPNVFEDVEQKANAKFILDQTLRTEADYNGEQMAYGIIVKNESDYDFFSSAILDNRIALMTRQELEWSKKDNTVTSKENLFDPKGPYFINYLIGVTVVIGLIIIFGCFYEGKRKEKWCFTKKNVS